MKKNLLAISLALLAPLALLNCGDGDDKTPDEQTDAGPKTDAGPGKTDAGPDAGPEEEPACNPVSGDGCTAPKKCTVVDDELGCAAAGVNVFGNSCAADKDCARGLFCLSDQGQGACVPFCEKDTDCPAGSDFVCNVSLKAGGPKLCGPKPCDPVKADACKTGEKCTFINPAGALACIPSTGTKGDQEECANDGECRAGLFCTKFESTAKTKCHAFCHKDSHCPAPADDSLVAVCGGGIVQGQPPIICRQIASCDPLLQNCAKATDACVQGQSGPVCVPQGTGAEGATCGQTSGCKKGLMCVSKDNTSFSCAKICNLEEGEEPGCTTGACQPLQDVEFGACG